jgi:hypothetical protein
MAQIAPGEDSRDSGPVLLLLLLLLFSFANVLVKDMFITFMKART